MGDDQLILVMKKEFKVSAERLFDAWTKPELMAQWFHANEKWTTPVAEADLKVGGAWRLEMRTTEGQTHPARGKYVVIERPAKLVFTWHPYNRDDYETTVTLLFKKIGDNLTELVLTHEGLQNEKDKANHTGGWMGCLGTLDGWCVKG